MLTKFKLKQWHTDDDVEEVVVEFDGGIETYFQHHINQINDGGHYKIVTSNKNDNSFFIELTEGKFHTVKCTAEML